MQNSLERLLEGMATSLHESVQPHLEDDFARAQVRAAVELLGNLATRVAWRSDYVVACIERVRRVLHVADDVAPHDDLPLTRGVLAEAVPSPLDPDHLVTARRDHLAALAETQQWASTRAPSEVADLDRAVAAFLRWQLEDELVRLQTASFGRSP